MRLPLSTEAPREPRGYGWSMPTLNNVTLAVTTTEPSGQITITVDCDVAFSATDLHAMRELNRWANDPSLESYGGPAERASAPQPA